jgi:hypothetical protein
MQLDFGLAGVVQMMEERFGRRATGFLLLLLYVALVAACIYFIVEYLVLPVVDVVKWALPHAQAIEINTITILYICGFTAAAVLLYPVLQFFWQQRRVPQKVLDRLAELRKC